jgi:hypothetical protein
MSLRHEIRRRGFFRFLTGGEGMTLEHATRDAGRELAQEHKRKSLESHGRAAPTGRSAGGIRQQFIAKLFGGLGHVRQAPRRPHVHDPLAELAHPVVAAPPVELMKVEPEPMSGQVIGVFTGASSGAELISETEFGPPMRSPVYQNWKRSIAENERRARMNGRWIG